MKKIIEIQEEVSIIQEDGTKVILEKGDRVEVLKEAQTPLSVVVAINNYMNDNANLSSGDIAARLSNAIEDAVLKNPKFSHEASDILRRIGKYISL